MSKVRLIKRLKWYYPTERFHTFVTFPALLVYTLFTYPSGEVVFLAYGLLVCIIILYQGQHYWKLKLERLEGQKIEQEKNIRFFTKAKSINRLLIFLMPIFLILQLYLNAWSYNEILLWGLLANVFAVLEHINYYHTQLMVDNRYDVAFLVTNRRLKKASLAKDMEEKKI
jgi:hypothetical protein